jgi:hypothetical protein
MNGRTRRSLTRLEVTIPTARCSNSPLSEYLVTDAARNLSTESPSPNLLSNLAGIEPNSSFITLTPLSDPT